MRKIIATNKAPEAIGPYSQGIVAGGTFLFTAGQIPMEPSSGEIVEGDIKQQTSRAIENLSQVLKAAGSDLDHVVKVTVFLKNMADFAVMNEIYARFFKDAPPARSAVEVSRLPKDVLIEIECIALIPEP